MSERRCPGCNGKISPKAQLCASCRRDANAIGASVVERVGTSAVAQPPAPAMRDRTPGQGRAYHGKCGTLARLRGTTPQEIKRSALEQASRMFRREIDSSKAMNEDEMSEILDWLDDEITAETAT